MIVVMKQQATQAQMDAAIQIMKEGGVKVMVSRGTEATVLGAEGNAKNIDQERLSQLPGVERVMRVSEPFKMANRKYHPDDTVVELPGGGAVGGKKLAVFAGPCSVESREQITAVAQAVKASGAQVLRGGAFKPRTSPYAFQGMGYEGLDLLEKARMATGLPVVTEIMDADDIGYFVEHVDVIQVGARNMQNFELLKEAGKSGVPVLLKRGLSATIDEWLNAAEYIISEGNPNIVLCERGIRTYETSTRNTLDISAIPVIRAKSHLPVIADPSHATGVRAYVEPLAKAAVAAGADGLMIEVHPCPSCALSDGPQSLTFEQFDTLMNDLRPFAQLVGRSL